MTDARARLTSPDKVLWPDAAITKRHLRAYYETVADRLLREVRDRPLTLRRHPGGVDADGFFTKNLPAGAPDTLPRHALWTPSSDRTVTYPLARDVDDLRWLANQNTVEVHALLTRTDDDDRPDRMVLDLDPPDGAAFADAVEAARAVGAVLSELGIAWQVKTSGKRGLHVVVPVERRYGFDEVRGLGLAVARATADRAPDRYTTAMRKDARGGRLLLDWSRNGAAQTLVAAWSPRRTPTATVSVPLAPDELDAPGLDPSAFTLATAADRPDAWADPPAPQRLERARDALTEAGFPPEDLSPRSSRAR